MYSANISASFQHCLLVDMTSQNCKTSNQRWNNVAYVNVGIYNVEQRRINVAYFNVDLNNVTQCRNNVVNMTIWKKTNHEAKYRIIFLSFKEKLFNLNKMDLWTGCDPMDFEINLIFLIEPFFQHDQKSWQKLEYLENEKNF